MKDIVIDQASSVRQHFLLSIIFQLMVLLCLKQKRSEEPPMEAQLQLLLKSLYRPQK